MKVIDKIPYHKDILYDDSFQYNEFNQRICISKSFMKGNNKEQYFLKLFLVKGSNLICQGYIYFYLNQEIKSSDFIGLYVKPEYRNSGFASLLVASWIQFCLNNGYDFLGTNKKQRKPFLIYLLKTYGFEILNHSIYENSNYVISICQEKDSYIKYLLFKNQKQKETFMKGKIAEEDDYRVINELGENMSYLDHVLLSTEYNLLDDYKANEKSTLVIQRHKK